MHIILVVVMFYTRFHCKGNLHERINIILFYLNKLSILLIQFHYDCLNKMLNRSYAFLPPMHTYESTFFSVNVIIVGDIFMQKLLISNINP